MFPNPLARHAGLKVGEMIPAVLVEHYFHRLKHDVQKSGCLKHDDVLYHEAFTIIKVSYPSVGRSFFDLLFEGCFKSFNIVSTSPYTLLALSTLPCSHTIEDLQGTYKFCCPNC